MGWYRFAAWAAKPWPPVITALGVNNTAGGWGVPARPLFKDDPEWDVLKLGFAGCRGFEGAKGFPAGPVVVVVGVRFWNIITLGFCCWPPLGLFPGVMWRLVVGNNMFGMNTFPVMFVIAVVVVWGKPRLLLLLLRAALMLLKAGLSFPGFPLLLLLLRLVFMRVENDMVGGRGLVPVEGWRTWWPARDVEPVLDPTLIVELGRGWRPGITWTAWVPW